jgi:DNA polymerase-3 subunit delta
MFYGGDDSIADVLNAAMTMSMMGGKKVVLLRSAEKLTEKEAAALVSYSKDPADSTVLVISARGVGKAKVKGMPLPPGKLGGLLKCAAVSAFGKLREGDIRKWVTARFQKEGKEIDGEAVDILVDFIGQDMTYVSNEVEKILTYLGDQKRAAIEDVEAMIPYLRVHSVFELTDALSVGDEKRAVKIIREILSGGTEPHQVLPTIRWHFMRLWTLKVMMEGGVGGEAAAKELKIPFFRQREYIDQAERISHGIFRDALCRIYNVERVLKTRSVKGSVVLDKLAMDITADI